MEEIRNEAMAGATPVEAQAQPEGAPALEATGTAAQPEPSGRTFTQAEVDRMIRQRLARAQRDAEVRLETARAEARDEAERLARMSGEERLRHDREQLEQDVRRRDAELTTREAAVVRRELRAEASELLARRALPGELGELLDYTDAGRMGESLERLERVYRAAVQAGVDARLGRSGVRLTAGAGGPGEAEQDDAAYYAALGMKQ